MSVMTASVGSGSGTGAEAAASAAAEGSSLRYRWCRWCRTAAEDSRVLCPVCGSSDMVEAVSAGGGTVRRLLGAIGGRATHQQRCVVVMDEGFTARGTVLDVLPGQVSVGSRVTLIARASRGPARGTYFRTPA